MVFYRKYRPQSLDELIGQSSVKQTLQKAFLEDKLAHAYLFCGPRGTGKTSSARILAKMVNCELEDKSKKPCNNCSTCLSITDGSNLDLIEIDAASNRGIDDIRTLRENIKLAPSSSKKKVYIIDEVHMLSQEAFNALLKTLEEPPAHVLFILATTEEQKIPITILSRVQKLNFKLASPEDIIADLKIITESENLKIEDEALNYIAKKSEGSFRDAEKLLDQISTLEPPITLNAIEDLMRSAKFENISSLLETLFQKDVQKSLEVLTAEAQSGINIKEYLTNLLENLRYIFLLKNSADSIVHKDLSDQKVKQLKKLSEQISLKDLNNLIKILQDCAEKIKFSPIPTFPLEVAIAEFCLGNQSMTNVVLGTIRQSAEMTPESDSGHHPEDGRPLDEARMTNRQENITTSEPKVVQDDNGRNESPEVSAQSTSEVSAQINDSTNNEKRTNELTILQDKWTYILETVRSVNFSLEAILRSVKLSSYEGDIVLLEVPYAFHQRILETPKNRDVLESVLSDVLSNSVKISTIINKPTASNQDLVNVEVAADDEIIRIASEIFNSDPLIPSETAH